MSTEPFIGEVKIFAFNFAPKSYSTCNGQLLPISQNSALFALLGTIYGGDGVNTFALPNLQGRMPIGQGKGVGLPPRTIGEAGGNTNASLTFANLPAHVHSLSNVQISTPVFTGGGESSSPAGAFPATATSDIYAAAASPNSFMGKANVSGNTDPAGGNQPIDITNPYLVMNYSIALAGIFPAQG